MSERRHAGNPEQESLQKAPLRTPQWSASFFERSNLLALLLDSRGTVVRANSAVKQLLADHGRQLAGTPLESYLLGPEHGRLLEEAILENREEAGGPVEIGLRSPREGPVYTSWNWVRESTPAGAFLTLLGEDITDRIHRERKLSRIRRELQRSADRARLLNRISAAAPLAETVDEALDAVVRTVADAFVTMRVVYGTISAEGRYTVEASYQPAGMPSLLGVVTELEETGEYWETLRQRRPIVVRDTELDSRTEPLTEAMAFGRTRAILDVPVVVVGELVGMLSLDSDTPRSWSGYEVGLLQEVADYLGLLIQIKRGEVAIAAELREKRTLLNEIHHRVKNNLNVIASLLNMQSSQCRSVEDVERAFANSRSRVQAMALVHKKLYEGERLATVEMHGYLKGLIDELGALYGGDGRIALTLDCDPYHLHIDQATPCGLLVNELVTNAFTHAFRPEEKGRVLIALKARGDGGALLTIGDDGCGLPAGWEESKELSLGLQLVELLTEQLGATLTVTVDRGTRFELLIPG